MTSNELDEELDALVAIFGDQGIKIERGIEGAQVKTEPLRADDAPILSVQARLEFVLPPEYPNVLPGMVLLSITPINSESTHTWPPLITH